MSSAYIFNEYVCLADYILGTDQLISTEELNTNKQNEHYTTKYYL